MAALRDVISSAKQAVLFLMFTPGKQGLHTLAGQRAREKGMYVRGVVSTLSADEGGTEQNFLDIDLVSSDRKFTPDRYAVAQPQGLDAPLGPWIAEVNRRTFLSQIGHAIVHSKILVTDPHTDDCVVVTGSHNFSAPASEKNDENLVIVRGHKKLAAAYASYVMSVYAHYRYRSYIREMRAQGKTPWSYLDDDDQWAPEKLRLQLDAAARASAEFVYGPVAVTDGTATTYVDPAPDAEALLETLLCWNEVPAGSSNVLATAAARPLAVNDQRSTEKPGRPARRGTGARRREPPMALQ